MYKEETDENCLQFLLDQKNQMLKEAKRKLDNLHKMNLTDIDAFKLKFERKNKETIDIIQRLDLSIFDNKLEFDINNINAPIFCYSNNTLVEYATQ